jgi:DNA-binding NtrC family response regulator
VAAPEAAQPAAPVSGFESSCSAATILVVEDEDALRMPVCKVLRKKGFLVVEACNGCTAAEVFRAKAAEIGAVLLDMTLPGISGRDLFEEFRRIRPDIKVILTSAYSPEMVTEAVGGPGAWEFIRKPYSLGDLLLRLQKTLALPDSSRSAAC